MPDTDLDRYFDSLRAPVAGDARGARARGDRLRRRRTASALAGSVAATALVVGGVAWTQAGPPSSAPDPVAPRPTPTVTDGPAPTPTTGSATVLRIPPDFPLAAGWPAPDPEDRELDGPSPDQPSFDGAVICGETNDLAPRGAVARLGARLSGISSGGDRLLLVYRTAEEASGVLARTVADLDQCKPDPDAPLGEERLVSLAQPLNLGDEAARVTMTSYLGDVPGIYATPYHLVRVGNALVLDFWSTEGAGASEAGLARVEREAEDRLRPVVEAMCVWSAEGC